MSAGVAAGVDLGGTKILSVVATEEGHVLGEDRRPTHAAEGPDAVLDRIVESLQAALAQAETGTDGIAGVGISTPGPCDPERGIVTNAPNLPGWENIPLAAIVSERLGVPTVMENDAAAACYGEYRYGAGQGLRHIIYLTVSTGIGAGIMIDGELYGGASGAAGEVGHIIVDNAGPMCNCGNRGCVEAFSSGYGIARAAAEAIRAGNSPALADIAGGETPTAEMVHQAAQEGDRASREIIERAGHHLGLGLIGMLNSFNPEALILGGGLLNMGDMYLGPALRAAREGAFEQILSDVTIVQARLGNMAGALGAMALMLRAYRR